MKGSFSRLLEGRADRLAVMLQQGRVLLDADWNLLAGIVDDRLRTLATDLVGVDGTAATDDSLRIIDRGGLDFTDTAGVGLSVPGVGPMVQAVAEGGFTFEAILHDTPDAVGTIIGGINAGGSNVRLYVTPERTLRFELGDRGVQASLPGAGRHLHVAVVSERHVDDVLGLAPARMVWRLYIDGERVAESDPQPPLDPAIRLVGMMIGAVGQPMPGTGATEPYRLRGALRGRLAAVALWTRPLESAEVRYSRCNWMRVPDSETSGRLAYWPFDEGQGDYTTEVTVGDATPSQFGLWIRWPQGSGPQRATWSPASVAIMPGRAYVGGLPAALNAALPIDEQPDFVQPMPTHDSWIAYLEVFPREYGVYDDPSIGEVALGGVDTTVHLRAVARTRLYRGTEAEWNTHFVENAPAKLRMSARWGGVGGPLANDLYRVEIACAGSTYRTYPETAADDMSGLGTLAVSPTVNRFTFSTASDDVQSKRPSSRVGSKEAATSATGFLDITRRVGLPTQQIRPADDDGESGEVTDPRVALYRPGRMAVMIFEADETVICYTRIDHAEAPEGVLQWVDVEPEPTAIVDARATAQAGGVRARNRLFAAPDYYVVDPVTNSGGRYMQVRVSDGDPATWPAGQLVKLFLGDDPTALPEPLIAQATVVVAAPATDDASDLIVSLSPTPQAIIDHLSSAGQNTDGTHAPVLAMEPLAALRWAADNASTAYRAQPAADKALRIIEQTGDNLVQGNWVEVVRPEERTARLPTRTYKVSSVDQATDNVVLDGYDPNADAAAWEAGELYLRRWFGRTEVSDAPLGVIPLSVRTAIPLEHGITVQFEPNQSGAVDVTDYWQIPTRSALPGGIEWQTLHGQPVPRAPMGPPVYRAPLASLTISTTGTAVQIEDLRRRVLTTTEAFSQSSSEQSQMEGITLAAQPQMADMHQALAALLQVDRTPPDANTGRDPNAPKPPPTEEPLSAQSTPPGSPWRTSGITETAAVRMRFARVGDTLWVFGDDGRWFAFDPGIDAVVDRGVLPTEAQGRSVTNFAVAAIDETIYLVGGGVGSGVDRRPVSSVWTFDTTAGKRTFEAALPVQFGGQPVATEGHALVALRGVLYLLGGSRLKAGQAPSTEVTDQILSWQPAASDWTVAGSLKTARTGAGAAVVGTRIYVVGGSSTTGSTPQALGEVEFLEPSSSPTSGTPAANLLSARLWPGVAVIGDQLFAVGGIDDTGSPSDSVEWLDTSDGSAQFQPLGVSQGNTDPALAALAFGGRAGPAAAGVASLTAGGPAWLYVIGGAQSADAGTLPTLMRPLVQS